VTGDPRPQLTPAEGKAAVRDLAELRGDDARALMGQPANRAERRALARTARRAGRS
jgi:hypothetical protein